MTHPYSVACDACHGWGFVNRGFCDKCGGTGRITVWAESSAMKDLRFARWINRIVIFLVTLAVAGMVGLAIWGILRWTGL